MRPVGSGLQDWTSCDSRSGHDSTVRTTGGLATAASCSCCPAVLYACGLSHLCSTASVLPGSRPFRSSNPLAKNGLSRSAWSTASWQPVSSPSEKST